MLNGCGWFRLFIFDHDFMVEDAAFEIFKSFHDLLLFDSVYVKQAMLLL